MSQSRANDRALARLRARLAVAGARAARRSDEFVGLMTGPPRRIVGPSEMGVVTAGLGLPAAARLQTAFPTARVVVAGAAAVEGTTRLLLARTRLDARVQQLSSHDRRDSSTRRGTVTALPAATTLGRLVSALVPQLPLPASIAVRPVSPGLVSAGFPIARASASAHEAWVSPDLAAAVGADSFVVAVPATRGAPPRLDVVRRLAGRGAVIGVWGVAAPAREKFLSPAAGMAAFGSFTAQEVGGGGLHPDPAWVRANIVDAHVPVFGLVRCHRLVVPQLVGALRELVLTGLADELHPAQFGGCYVPRYIAGTHVPSNHAWGIAVDLNVPENQRGTPGRLSAALIDVFRSWGFRWGGDWSYTDPMHFELSALLG
jgi:hypothetical protein